jgi:hypothetical protein
MERVVDVWTVLESPADRVRRVIARHPQRLLDVAELGVEWGQHHLGVHQRVDVELGSVTERDGTLTVPIAWRAPGHVALVPAVAGAIVVERADSGRGLLALRGTYTVPLGAVGRFGNGVLGHRAVRRSLEALLAELARRIDDAAEPLLQDGGLDDDRVHGHRVVI